MNVSTKSLLGTCAKFSAILGALCCFSGASAAPAVAYSLPKPCTAMLAAGTQMPRMQERCNPLAGAVWHAVGRSWPGTLTFNPASRQVTLHPVGQDPLTAKYTFTLGVKDKLFQGNLRMGLPDGRKSFGQFEVSADGQHLRLSYADGGEETYERMTAQQADEAMATLRQRLGQ